MYSDKGKLICLVLGLVILVSGGVIAAEDALLNSNQKAETDWEKAVVRAKGYGVAGDQIQNEARARILAREAAKTMAQRNLLEQIEGVNLNSTQKISGAQVESDVIKKRISGTLRGARVVEEKEVSQGSYMVVMEVKLYGKNGVMKAVLPTVKEESAAEEETMDSAAEQGTAEQTNNKGANNETASDSAQELAADYTGLIINTMNLAVEPAISPKIYNAQGEVIYSVNTLNTDEVITNGIVGYNRSLNAAKANPRIGENPLVINAEDVRGATKADVVLSEANAQKVLRAANSSNIFSETKVIIVLN